MDRLRQSFQNITKHSNKAFTLIELLIVIGILGVLAVTLLVTLNPAESQRKSRDLKRIKDAQTIQSILEQYLSDNATVPAAWSVDVASTNGQPTTSGTHSGGAGSVESQPCGANLNWISGTSGGPNLCSYAKSIPVDPANNTVRSCAGCTGSTTVHFVYRLEVQDGQYEVNVRQESTSNAGKTANDGGNTPVWYELFSNAGDLMTL